MGYLLAGVAIGPHTSGFMADRGIDAATIAKEVDRVRAETTGGAVISLEQEGAV